MAECAEECFCVQSLKEGYFFANKVFQGFTVLFQTMAVWSNSEFKDTIVIFRYTPYDNIAQGKKVTLKFKAMVNFGAPWPRHRPQGISEVYQCWWCVGVTEPDWQLLSACSLSVISSGHVPTPWTYQTPTTWFYACIYSPDKTRLSMCIRRE